jgi:hypothetical protein
MKTFLKLLTFVLGLSVITFTASAHCGSCEGDTPKDDHAQVTHHEDSTHHQQSDDKDCDKSKKHDEEPHDNHAGNH